MSCQRGGEKLVMFSISNGVQQGVIILLLLFNLYRDALSYF